MEFQRKKFCTGGAAAIDLRKLIEAEACGFKTKALILIDDVINMIPYLNRSNEANAIIDYLYELHSFKQMPFADITGSNSTVAPLRIYYILKESLKQKDKASYLLNKIKVYDKIIDIEDTDEPGINQ